MLIERIGQVGYMMIFKTTTLVYGKVWHLLIELEHKAILAMKKQKFDLTKAAEKKLIRWNDIDDFLLKAYKSSSIYT